MKKILSILLAGAVLLSSVLVSAYNPRENFDIAYFNPDTGEYIPEEGSSGTHGYFEDPNGFVPITDKKPIYYPQDIGNLRGFLDLGSVPWAVEAIEDMSTGTYRGLFGGTTQPDKNGLAKFSPNLRMTHAEFIAVVTRVLYSDVLEEMIPVSGGAWYDNNYAVAKESGLVGGMYGVKDNLPNHPISREEAAVILFNACKRLGESIGDLDSTDNIPDFDQVHGYYKTSVAVAYTMGFMTGKDASGRFDPKGFLTRAEGAVVLYRLVNKDARVKGSDTAAAEESINAPMTIYQGEERWTRPAKAGDTFVKKDGTKVVLKLGPNGILGEGQGVAADVGLLGQVTEKGCDGFTRNGYNEDVWYDSTGTHLQNEDYYINKTTGEGYWTAELDKLAEAYPEPDRDGSYKGEVSSDPLRLWLWRGASWSYNFYRGQ